MQYAGFWKRFWAYNYDVLIIAILMMVMGSLLGSDTAQGANDLTGMMGELQAPLNMAASGDTFGLIEWMARALQESLVELLLVSAPYNILFVVSRWQATPGKRFCGIKVVNQDGSRLTLLQSALRHAASGLSVLPLGLGFLPIIFTKEKTALHDMICGTRVVRSTTNP